MPRNRWAIWLSAANLVLTAIIGVGIALYVNVRQEQLQVMLSERQEQLERRLIAERLEAERQTGLAHITLQRACLFIGGCAAAVEVKNTGPAAAKNVQAVVYITSITDQWKPVITDIDGFSVRLFPAAVKVTKENRRVDILYDWAPITGSNAVELSLDTLPANSAFQVEFRLQPSVPIRTYEVTRTMTIVGQFPRIGDTAFEDTDLLRQYFEEQFAVVQLAAVSQCDNCEGRPPTLSWPVSTLGGWGFRLQDFREGASGRELTYQLHLNYRMPQGSDHTPVVSPLCLRVSESFRSIQPCVVETGSSPLDSMSYSSLP